MNFDTGRRKFSRMDKSKAIRNQVGGRKLLFMFDLVIIILLLLARYVLFEAIVNLIFDVHHSSYTNIAAGSSGLLITAPHQAVELPHRIKKPLHCRGFSSGFKDCLGY